jgi:hypothetical protein
VTNGGRPVQGSAELTPRGSGQGLRRVLSFVWALVPALSFGQLAPIPIIHAAIKLRTWTLWSASALYSAGTVLLWSATTTVTSGPVEPAEVSDPPLWTFPLLLGLMVVPTAQALVVRRRVFETSVRDEVATAGACGCPPGPATTGGGEGDRGPRRRPGPRAPDRPSRPATTVRRRRAGRPQPCAAPVMVQQLGLAEAKAAQVVEARDHIGAFLSAEEVIAHTDLSPTLIDGIRERLAGISPLRPALATWERVRTMASVV